MKTSFYGVLCLDANFPHVAQLAYEVKRASHEDGVVGTRDGESMIEGNFGAIDNREVGRMVAGDLG